MTQPDNSTTAKLRILIADDNHETRRNVRLMLALNPDVVVVAIGKNGQDAVELTREHHPGLVVLDINMPQLDGISAFKEISRTHPDIGCIIISGEIPLSLPESAPGMLEFLLKPFMVEELNDSVNRVAAAVSEFRRKQADAEHKYQQSEAYLTKMAEEYSSTRRTDDQALGVFEQLAQNPACELRWLQMLSVLYVSRQEWTKLKALAARLEQGQAGKQ